MNKILFLQIFTAPLFICIVFKNFVHCPTILMSHSFGCSCNRWVFNFGIFLANFPNTARTVV